jgi:1-phosphatidylinositol-4-phosphate 5-kinase
MPHAVEMPSFLADDTPPMFSSSRPFYDVPSHVRQSHDKVNGNSRSSVHTSIKGSLGEDSDGYMDGGNVVNGNRPHVNGDMLRDGSLNSITNGRSSASSWDHRSSRNGSTLSVNGALNGNGIIPENGRSPAPMQNGRNPYPERTSVASTNGNGPNLFVNPEARSVTNGDVEPAQRNSIPEPIPTNPQSTGPLTYTSSLLPASPTPAESPNRNPASPHRFSSPPTYPAPPIPSPSPNPLQHPGATQLKHRHTLQVPKAGPSRTSRDGDDAIYTSGRFSPTTLATGVRRGSLSLNRRNTQSIHSNMPHEEIAPDEDAMLWAEAVRQKRASKRRRKDEEDDDRVLVGTKVDQNHANYVTAYNMLTGIRFTVSRTNAKLDRPLTDADFEARHKFSFDM